MFLGEYLDKPEVTEIEKSLTKENFLEKATEAYRIIFEEEPHPAVFSGWKFFDTRREMAEDRYGKFDKYPFMDVELMEKGFHIFRMIFARHAGDLRGEGMEGFDNGIGIFKFEDYADNNFLTKVREEIEKFPNIENLQPVNTVANLKDGDFPNITGLVKKSDIFDRLCTAVRRDPNDKAVQDFYMKTTYVQKVDSAPGNGDIQKVCHSDVFFPCIKYWYFPYDVEPEDGPFTFGEYSIKLTKKILDFHYRESVAVVKGTWDRSRNKGHGEGSFRALDQDLSDMDIELKGQPVKANTLVMANVSGFHCRGEVTRRHVRSAIHGAIRMEDCFSVA